MTENIGRGFVVFRAGNLGRANVRAPISSAVLRGCAAIVAASAAALGGCADSDGAPPADALRAAFPARAAEVLEAGAGFDANATGFTWAGQQRAGFRSTRLTVSIPKAASEAIRFQLAGGREILVREVGAAGEAALTGRAVTYGRRGGASFWTSRPSGVEAWVLLEADAVRARMPAATWEVEGATVRQDGDAVVLADEAGRARLRVTAPAAYAADGRPLSPQLLARTGAIDVSVDAAGEAVLIDPIWQPIAEMSTVRYRHTATTLDDGRVLVAGGRGNGTTILSSAEIWDPETDTWSPAASMSVSRRNHTATLLLDGRVLVVGGYNNELNGYVGTSELYDPRTNTWSPARDLATARYRHTATRLEDEQNRGKVLILAGEASPGYLASAEMYVPDPAGVGPGTFLPAPPLEGPRARHTATLLRDDRLFIAGGQTYNDVSLNTTQAFDPADATWGDPPAMQEARFFHTAVVLRDGDLFVAGKADHSERFDVETSTWSLLDPIPYNPTTFEHAGAPLPGSLVLIAGGEGSGTSAALFDPADNSWREAAPMNVPRRNPGTAVLHDGSVLLTGGEPPTATSELYTGLALGAACTSADACLSGFCADGVCCDVACEGACQACAASAGAQADGTCAPTTGDPCQLDLCTEGSTCLRGTCAGGTAKACPVTGECEEQSTCDPASGACLRALKPTGTPCAGGVCINATCVQDEGAGGAGGLLQPVSVGSGGAGADQETVVEGTCGCHVPGAPERGADTRWALWILGVLWTAARTRRY